MREYEEADEYCPHCDNQYVSARRHELLWTVETTLCRQQPV